MFFHKSQVLEHGQLPLIVCGDFCEFSIEQGNVFYRSIQHIGSFIGKSGEMAVSIKLLERSKTVHKSKMKLNKKKSEKNSINKKTKLFQDSL